MIRAKKLYLTKGDYDDGCIERILLDHDRVRQDSEEAYRRLYQTNSGALYFAQSSEPNETWVSLLEKVWIAFDPLRCIKNHTEANADRNIIIRHTQRPMGTMKL